VFIWDILPGLGILNICSKENLATLLTNSVASFRIYLSDLTMEISMFSDRAYQVKQTKATIFCCLFKHYICHKLCHGRHINSILHVITRPTNKFRTVRHFRLSVGIHTYVDYLKHVRSLRNLGLQVLFLSLIMYTYF
jgi:hypothetical protein